MSLVLEGGSYSVGNFYLSRILRIFPAYFMTVIFAITLYLVALRGFDVSSTTISYFSSTEFQSPQLFFIFFVNIFIIGSELVWFAPEIFSTSFHPLLLLIIVPAWALSLELQFYIVAPFLKKISTKKLALSAALLVFTQTVCYVEGLDSDPWHARFSLFGLTFFHSWIRSTQTHQDESRAKGDIFCFFDTVLHYVRKLPKI